MPPRSSTCQSSDTSPERRRREAVPCRDTPAKNGTTSPSFPPARTPPQRKQSSPRQSQTARPQQTCIPRLTTILTRRSRDYQGAREQGDQGDKKNVFRGSTFSLIPNS